MINPTKDDENMMPRPYTQIVAELREHMDTSEATMNDGEVEDLYREAHRLIDSEETDLERVERWVQQTLQPQRKTTP